MGRIKQTFLKRIAQALMEEYPEEFTIDFEKNKGNVQKFTDIASKPMRNKIAGYITRAVKQKSTMVL